MGGAGVIGGRRSNPWGGRGVLWTEGGLVSSLLLELHKISKRKPCKSKFTALGATPRSSCFSLDCFQLVYSPSRDVRRCCTSGHEIEPKGTKNPKKGGSQTPQIVARTFFVA